MLKIKKYLLKFWPLMLICFSLLFVQSQTELALPDYMSDIVSTGIQAGGFDSGVSDVFSKETFDHLLLFVEDEDAKDLIEESYRLVEKEDAIKEYGEQFSNIQDDIYVLNDISSDASEVLNVELLKPMLIISMIDSADTSALPQGMTMYDMVSMMDDAKKDEMFKEVDKQIETMGASSLNIAAGNGVKKEYEKLGGDIHQVQMNYIFKTGLKMLGIALVSTLAAMTVAYCSSRFGAGVARDLRKDVFEKVESFGDEEFHKFSTASLITRTTNDITQVQMVSMMMLRIIAFAPIMGIGALIKAIKNSPSMTWIVGIVLVVIMCLIIVTFIVVLPKFKAIQKLVDRLNLTMRENLSGILVIRAFSNEDHSTNRFNDANKDLKDINIFVNRAMATLMPMMMFIMNAVTLVIVYYGAKQVDLGNIAIGQMMAFMQYAMHIIMSFLMIAMVSIMLPRASVAASRIDEILSTQTHIENTQNPLAFIENERGVVEYNNVSFTYPGSQEPVLENISFKAMPGKVTAFIGSTGSGKSTLIHLLPRFYDATSGSVKINGVNVKDVTLHDLRECIGFVPQKSTLFGGTIQSNLLYGNKNASAEYIDEIISIAQAKEFIEGKEEGLDSPIAQGGTNVSGGQKQRLSIARALMKKADVYIFDDSFSALDFKTDAKLRQELNQLIKKNNSTVLLVGQRIASIMDADQIIVLDKGRIVGQGKHQDLLETCQVYQEIAYSQLSKEELSNG